MLTSARKKGEKLTAFRQEATRNRRVFKTSKPRLDTSRHRLYNKSCCCEHAGNGGKQRVSLIFDHSTDAIVVELADTYV